MTKRSKILSIFLLTLITPFLCLFFYILIRSYQLDYPFPNVAADVLRSIIGVDAVMWLEENMYALEDWYRQQSTDAPTEINDEQLQSLTEPICVDSENPEGGKPNDIIPLINDPVMEDEGVWSPLHSDIPYIWTTQIRPDILRNYALVNLVAMDATQLEFHLILGNAFLDVDNQLGEGRIYEDIKERVIACFNGGFLPKHEPNGGIITRGKIRMPFYPNKATLLLYQDKLPQIINANEDFINSLIQDPTNVYYARQNQSILVEDGLINYQVVQWGMVANTNAPVEVDTTLGPEFRPVFANLLALGLIPPFAFEKGWIHKIQLPTNRAVEHRGVCAWRSAIGLTPQGHLIYGAGNSLTAQTLAYALKLAGCVQAMHMDMNKTNVAFNYYTNDQNGLRSTQSLDQRFAQSLVGKYLQTYNHDFICVCLPEHPEQ